MADKKISALTAASTPLAGTEVLPIVQSGATVKVSVADLTTGRNLASGKIDVTYADATYAAGITVTNTSNTIASQAKVYAVNNAGDYFSLGRNSAALGSQSVLFSTGAFPIDFYTNTNYVASFTSAGNLSLATGNLVIATSGKGIDFSATPGTGTSELLADYEEGSWTPIVTADTGSITAYSASGSYTKVGNIVELRFAVNVSNVGTAVGAMRIAGLPFTSVNYADTYPAGTFLVRETALTGQSYQGFNNANSTNAFVAALSGATVAWTNGVVYVFSGTYRSA